MMSVSDRLRFTIGSSVVALSLCGAMAHSQGEIVDPASKELPNPNPTVIKVWGELPAGRTWGMTAGVEAGPDGQIWAYERCGANTCEGSNLDPVLKFDRKTGKLLKSFGGGTMVFPHGLHVDHDGNIWFGTPWGIDVLSADFKTFTHYASSSQANSLSSDNVFAIRARCHQMYAGG